MAEYKISASLSGHEDDVRALSFSTPTLLHSVSRDATLREWNLKNNPIEAHLMHNSDAFINAVTYISPPISGLENGLVASAGKDALIDVRQPGAVPDTNAESLLLGHESNVCALDSFNDGKTNYLVSGSWDGSARVWDIAAAKQTAILEGHEASVWDVLAFDDNTIVTACADQRVRIFSKQGKLLKKVSAGSEPVRALCKLPQGHSSGAQFASAGNDGIIRLWTLEGIEVAQLIGHENFVYSLAASSSGEIFSSSEDRTVRVWRDGQCLQTITHPAISVWSVVCNKETGDIATGASDKIVRVFTRSKERFADPSVVAAFEDSVKASAIPQQTMGEVNKEKLPGPDFLKQKSGTKEGQVQMIREHNGTISAHQWSTAAQQWINIGTVVDSAGSSGRTTSYGGQDYDYVFDVDIEDGKPPLKLPFNLSQNPYDAANKFLADNELPSSYLEQTVKFIMDNTQGATLGQSSAPAGSDPWGSDRRYRPGDADATQAAPTPSLPSSRPKVLPQKEYLSITTANLKVITKKLIELNDKLLADGRKDVALSPNDTKLLETLSPALEAGLTSPSTVDASKLASLADLVVPTITRWPESHRLPGLDMYRLLCYISPTLAIQHPPLRVIEGGAALLQTPNNAMLALRALVNLFPNSAGQAYIQANLTEIHAFARPFVADATGRALSRNALVAAATLYINLAVLLTSTPGPDPASTARLAAALLADLSALLKDPKIVDSEVVYRALVAVGTLLRVPPADGVTVDGAALASAVERAVKSAKEPRIRGVGEEIQTLL